MFSKGVCVTIGVGVKQNLSFMCFFGVSHFACFPLQNKNTFANITYSFLVRKHHTFFPCFLVPKETHTSLKQPLLSFSRQEEDVSLLSKEDGRACLVKMHALLACYETRQ